MSSTASLGVSGPGYNIAKIRELSELQLKDPFGSSFHDSHVDSCYVYVGGLDKRLTEGDVLAVFSEWGEIVDINLIRDKEKGESKGFGFIAYEDQRSTVLAVDNANGILLLDRPIRVDHVTKYVAVSETKAEKSLIQLEDEKRAAKAQNAQAEEDEKLKLWRELKTLKERVQKRKRQLASMGSPQSDSEP